MMITGDETRPITRYVGDDGIWIMPKAGETFIGQPYGFHDGAQNSMPFIEVVKDGRVMRTVNPRYLSDIEFETAIPDHEDATKTPIFFLDAADDMGNAAIGMATDMPLTERNMLAYVKGALDRLMEAGDGDGSQIILALSRRDMTDEELDALPED